MLDLEVNSSLEIFLINKTRSIKDSKVTNKVTNNPLKIPKL